MYFWGSNHESEGSAGYSLQGLPLSKCATRIPRLMRDVTIRFCAITLAEIPLPREFAAAQIHDRWVMLRVLSRCNEMSTR